MCAKTCLGQTYYSSLLGCLIKMCDMLNKNSRAVKKGTAKQSGLLRTRSDIKLRPSSQMGILPQMILLMLLVRTRTDIKLRPSGCSILPILTMQV